MELLKRLENLSPLIGNTPLVELTVKIKNHCFKIYCKCEMFNLTGSIKDRCVYSILHNSIKQNLISGNSVFMECTSGNTGISLSCMGGYLNKQVIIVMPKTVSKERAQLLKLYGATLVFSDNDMRLTLQNEAQKYKDAFFINQFENKYNSLAHFSATAPEIEKTLKKNKINPNAFCCGVGTGGTFMGISEYLKSKYEIKAHPLQSENVNLLKGGNGGAHLIQGLASEFTPKLFDLNFAKDVISVNDIDSVYVAQLICKQTGLGVGISAGANVLGALKCCLNYGYENCVTVFPDDNKKYLSTILSEKVNPSNFAKQISFTGVKVL